jgi:hypothetical protein
LSVSSRNQRSTSLSHDEEVGGEVRLEPGVFVEPGPHALMLVGGVVVTDQVHRKFFGDLSADRAQEFQELGIAVPGQALPDDFAGQHVQRREQRGGAVCGFNPRAAHTRCTVAGAPKPWRPWSDTTSGSGHPAGNTLSDIRSRRSSPAGSSICGHARPGPSPASPGPFFANRTRRARTVAGFTPTCAAILVFATPSAASNSAFAR